MVYIPFLSLTFSGEREKGREYGNFLPHLRTVCAQVRKNARDARVRERKRGNMLYIPFLSLIFCYEQEKGREFGLCLCERAGE